MKKIYFILFIFCSVFSSFFSTGFAQANISNVIVFGDSLSDIGNFPMTSIITPNANKPLETASNVYVPISNPIVIPSAGKYTLINQPNVQLTYPILPLHNHLFPPQPPLQQQPRLHRSMGWAQYFIMDVFGSSQHIIPSMYLPHAMASQRLSVDYAFNSAMSFAGCSGWLYRHPNKSCTRQQILSGIKAYERYQIEQAKKTFPNQKQDSAMLLIPGLRKQVELFKEDRKHKRLYIDDHTVYIIMIGGNDINHSYINIKSLQWHKMEDSLNIISRTSINNTKQAIYALIQSPVQAQHIIVVNLFNLGLVPEVYEHPIQQFIFHMVSRIYDDMQRHMVLSLQKRYPALDIRLFNANALTNQLAFSRYFHNTLGKSCDSQPGYYTAAANSHNCYVSPEEKTSSLKTVDRQPSSSSADVLQKQKNKKSVIQQPSSDQTVQGYLFWNRYHFSSLYYQIFAYSLAQFITKGS